MKNPFTLSFGKEPIELLSRPIQTNLIIDTFDDNFPSSQVFMITGPRGSGKTVLLTTVSKQLNQKKDWITIPLNPERDMLQALAARLYDHKVMKPLFLKAKLDLSILGIGVSIEGADTISDVEVAIERMLEVAKKREKKVLITIDEVISSTYIREFISAFQIFIRQDFPLYLLMTGLYENINRLQNEKTLTFLYRAPKIAMDALNLTLVASRYQKIFEVSKREAQEMASYTKGYPFAFQVLGYLLWQSDTKKISDVETDFDVYMEMYVYEKMWSELTSAEQTTVSAMAELGDADIKVQDLRSAMNSTSNQFTGYRNGLLKKGILISPSYGYLSFALPRFREFVQRRLI